MKQIFYFFLLIFFVFSKNILALPSIINPIHWEEIAPAKADINFYDELFTDVIPRVWRNISPHGYNYGTKALTEVMIWEGEDFCGYIAYQRIFDPGWAYDFSYDLGMKIENLWEQTKMGKTKPYFNEKCALYDPDQPPPGKARGKNTRLTSIQKKKGMKGNREPVRVQRFGYTKPKFECLMIAGGLGTSGWAQYDSALVVSSFGAHLCVKDGSYFTQDKIKQLARSIGVDDIDTASLKIKSPPPSELRLDLSAYKEITGKRENYYIDSGFAKVDKVSTKSSKNNKIVQLSSDEIEEKLRKLKELFEKELISQTDYTQRKKTLLDLL